MEIYSVITVFVMSILASSFGTLTGGTSLITIPVLMLLGLPPHVAIGTDRFGIIGLGLSGWYKFQSKRLIDYPIAWMVAVPIFAGTFIGSNIVLQISGEVLRSIVIFINIALLIFLLVNPRVGVEKGGDRSTVKVYLVGFILSLLVGLWGGFYGALTGTFTLYVLILVYRQTFIQSAATMKIPNIVNAVTAATVFAFHGAVDFRLGMAMMGGCLIGSYTGVHFSERIGELWIKRIFLLVTAAAIVKLVLNT